ncbi:GDP-L-galactose phosphorylase 1-like [Cucurbita pepo subsp. pepo]|uniref:GDP-L-galactose phosphorylase 1-like n=1 Tax=Cucurbita pepo subsp. pepo TaxID=3664 RepID=UPI000C9D8826|nr:GDP-L-galactose phosphorylase 1-like [Cucurbita pepo subsp. pepo]XP_023520018.1 GDP-L-galactose phosphorylase 1-like [Cucurbita pepo subsp. pepo]XP_023520019.1 GDP-L-galactose phosphorylase 1-like [Cucurbita pepo subsp. pepo]XP_023520020.1 GDP-L-galactose phosphorylase 1-like [Cucurbita pepo subsp. pepo]XP_023520021.1 GDP-L-galactose phosphorylase 1-like [Cucurbita pepo subsp. pepo]XP_023520022.1 GDP-L-galactose phosphorylase 1-like [Cucurbita pepo subsp. pepo]XP_023520023.1 GDP-L-galactos
MVQAKQIEDENLCSKYTENELLKTQKSCMNGIRLPLYQFGRNSPLDDISLQAPSDVPLEEQTILESILLAKWEEKLSEGHFRYDVTLSEIKAIVGQKKFLAQLNESWTNPSLSQYEEIRKCDHGSLFQTNWLKCQEELLFCISRGENNESKLISASLVPTSSILVMINATPVEYGHVILLPCAVDGPLQFLDDRSLELEMLLRLAVEINNFALCLFYECSTPRTACPFFQALFFSSLLPVEAMAVDTFFSDSLGEIYVSTITDYPVKALLFESSCNLKKMGQVIAEICSHLQEKCVLYNLLIRDCGKKIFLFLQSQGSDRSSILSPWECWGYFLFKSRSEFDQATEDALLDRIAAAASLDDAEFQGVKQFCCDVAGKVSF